MTRHTGVPPISSEHVRCFFFFFNDTATTEIYTLSLHDALPILEYKLGRLAVREPANLVLVGEGRSEEHTSELQSPSYLVCRLLLEKNRYMQAGFSVVETWFAFNLFVTFLEVV